MTYLKDLNHKDISMAFQLPSIALIGRPNVGKSTLFNRLIRSNRAITHDRPGVTRDRIEGIVRIKDKTVFGITDTGGITMEGFGTLSQGPDESRGFEREILAQADAAMQDAIAVALVVDGREGLLPMDEFLADRVRRSGKPTILVVNKVDGLENEDIRIAEFHGLGFPIVAVSAAHGVNIRLLEETLADFIPEDFHPEKKETALRLALLGRPNAGKSSLVNVVSGKNRMIVSDIAGTTRDSVDVDFEKDGEHYVFVDTAGIRRRTKISDSVEKYSVNASIKSSTKADVTLVVIDASCGASQQDKRLISMLDERKTPFMVILSKSDLLPQNSLKQVKKDIEEILSFCPHVPLLLTSSQTEHGIKKILPLARRIHRECSVHIGTGQLNRAVEEVLTRHQPPVVKRVRAKFYYMTQAETTPPTFVFFVSDEERVPETYRRYLERSLRKIFDIQHAPMRVRFRSTHKKKEK